MDNMAVKHRWGRLYKGCVTLVKPGSAALQMSSVLNQFNAYSDKSDICPNNQHVHPAGGFPGWRTSPVSAL